MKKDSAVKLLKDVADSFPFSEWLDEQTVQTFAQNIGGVAYMTTIELVDEPDGIIAISAITFPEPFVSHRKFDKGMKKFLKMMSKQKAFEVRFSAPHLMVMGGAVQEGTTVEQIRELTQATFGVANNAFSGMIQYLDS